MDHFESGAGSFFGESWVIVRGNPDIATTSAETEVRVRDNETIVIGGLDSRNDSPTEKRHALAYVDPYYRLVFSS